VTLRAYHASPPGRQGGPGREQLAGPSAGAPRPAPGPRSTRAPSAGASPRQPQARAGAAGVAGHGAPAAAGRSESSLGPGAGRGCLRGDLRRSARARGWRRDAAA